MNPYKDEWKKAMDDISDYMLGAADLLSECTGNTAITIADYEIDVIMKRHYKEAIWKEAMGERIRETLD